MPDFHLPTTISAEARAALAERTLLGRNFELPLPSDLPAWREKRHQIEDDFRQLNTAVVTQYEPTIQSIDLGLTSGLDIRPQGWTDNGRVLLYVHGGAYTLFSTRSTLVSSVPTAHDTGLRVIAVEYSLAPEANYEQSTCEIIAAVTTLTDSGIDPSRLAIYGDSAGGALAAVSVLKMREQRLPLPAAVVLLSPWSDIAEVGDSYTTLRDADPVLYYPDNLARCAVAYAAAEEHRHPYVSPVYGDFATGFPPTLIQAGGKEIFLSNAIRLYRALDTVGQTAVLDVYEGMWHVFQAFPHDLPESAAAREKMSRFLGHHLA